MQKRYFFVLGDLGHPWAAGALPCSVALVFFKNNASHAAWRSFLAAGVAPAVGQEQHQNTKKLDGKKLVVCVKMLQHAQKQKKQKLEPQQQRKQQTIKQRNDHAKKPTPSNEQTINQTKQTISPTTKQSKEETIKQTIKQQKNPKKKPYIKKLATPDRPPPAAIMLQMQYSWPPL